MFVRPAFYAALLSPLAFFRQDLAFDVWVISQALLLLLCSLWAWRRFGPDALIFAALSLPAPWGLPARRIAFCCLPIWLTIFHSRQPASRIAATLMATPLPFLFALAEKPWAIVSSASMLVFFAVLAYEKVSSTAKIPNVISVQVSPVNS